MNFLLVKPGFILNKLFQLSRLPYIILLLFISQSAFSQVQPLEITDFIMYGGSGGVYIGSSNTINSGSIGSDVLVQSTGNAFIQSNIFSQGRIILTNSNEVTGNIGANALGFFSGNILDIGSSAVIIGNIDVNGDILIGGGSITGIVTQPVGATYSGPEPSGGYGTKLNIPAGPNMPLITTFPAAGTGDDINGTTTLIPGAYSNITLKGKSTITFNGPGVYIFNSIKAAGNNNKFVFDFQGSTNGKFYIYIHEDVDLGKINSNLIGGSATRILAEVHGAGATSKSGFDAWSTANGNGGGSKWLGTVWAPFGGINIGSGTGSTSLSGALWSGTQVHINSGVTLNYEPFELCTEPIVDLGADVYLCADNTGTTLAANVTGSPAGNFTYVWSNGKTTNTIQVNPSSTTPYSVIVTDLSSGVTCTGTDEIIVNVNNTITVTAVADVTFVCPESPDVNLSAQATGGTGPYTYEWFDGSLSVGFGETITVTPTANANYTVVVTDNFGAVATDACSATSAVIPITYTDICPYYAPTTKVEDLIGSELTSLSQTFGAIGTATSDFVYQINGDQVLVDIIVQPNKVNSVVSLLTGTYNVDPLGISINDLIITTFFPMTFLTDFNSRSDIINFVRPVFLPLSNGTGLVTQGDGAQRSDIARDKFKLAGAGVKVGVISDSYNKYIPGTDFAAADVISEDLPVNVQVTSSTGDDWDYPYGGSDEGRAMLQIVHDIAPEAALAFRTGFISESDFAQGIYDLYDDAQCDIIVDDITYITEPFYKSGLVAQAIDYVTASGGTYITSAGNFGTNGYESLFTPSVGDPTRHAFDGSNDDLQLISLKQGTYTIVLQWDDFFYSDEPIVGGAANPDGAEYDFDIYLADLAGNILFGFNRNNLGGDPIEILPFNVNAATADANLIIAKAAGPSAPVNLKYVVFRSGDGFTQQYNDGTSTIVGHAANNNAITVAAARYDNLTQVEAFSSRGSMNAGELGFNKPDITNPDGGNTTVTSFNDYSGDLNGDPNFFGTSAAAPHAAGVAALLLDDKMAALNVQIAGSDIKALLAIGAANIGTDAEGGAGLVQADKIFESLIAPVGQITSLTYTPTDGTPGTILITITIEGNYLSAGTEIYVDDSPLPTGTVILDNGDGTFTLQGEVATFLGDPDVQVWSPGIGDTYPRLSEPVSFFEGKTTIIISADTDPEGASDANKLFGESDPAFTVKLLNSTLGELDPNVEAQLRADLANYLEFRTSGDADWRLDWIAPNYVIEPFLNDLYTTEQSGAGGMEEIYNFSSKMAKWL